ncbi:MAG: flagellar export protein FliJ [Gammaproteobacteria bacterium]|nr:flagellar export protein FliJ [Gammaproteobacteria bacterium]
MQKNSAIGSQGFNAQQLNEYRIFLAKLTTAIVQQGNLIAKAESDFQACQKSWLLSRTNSKALENMVERYKNEEFMVQAKKEQKDLDERAMRLGLKGFD